MSQTVSSTDCFENLVALRGTCNDAVPTSGLYLNDLGIDLNFVSQVITKDYVDESDFITRKFNFSIQTVANQIHNFLRPKYKANTVIENFRVGHHQDNLVVVPGTGTFKGIEIDLCQSSSYLDVLINEIDLQLSYTGTVNVLIYDLLQDELLDTVEIDVVADKVSKVYFNKLYKSDRKRLNLFIGYDTTGINSITTRLKKSCINCSGGYYSEINNQFEKIHAVEITNGDPFIQSSLSKINETGGLSVVHSLSCNHENWLCSISNTLAFPVLYHTAYLVYDHAQTAKDQRTNTSVTVNAEMVDERKKHFYDKYAEAMNNLLQNMLPPSDELCFACKNTVRHVVMIP